VATAVADQLRSKFPKLAAVLDRSEADVLAFMGEADMTSECLQLSRKGQHFRERPPQRCGNSLMPDRADDRPTVLEVMSSDAPSP
jgi:hypothetical protein